jgi:hypothetical protein
MPLPAVLLLLLFISSSTSSQTSSPPHKFIDDFILTAAIDSPSCALPHILSRCIALALRHRSAASPSPSGLISHAAVSRRLSALVTPSALASASVHNMPSTSSSYTACLTLASSFLSLRLLPLAVQLARACAVIWPNVPQPSVNVKTCTASLQRCLIDAITCDASAATQAQHAAHGTITHRLQRPLCALPALLVYLSIFSRSPSPPPPLVMQGAQACVSASLYHCGFLLLTQLRSSSAKAPSPCLVTWLSIMSLRLLSPSFPSHMFTPNCIPLLLLLAQGDRGVGGAAVHTLASLWPLSVPLSPFLWSELSGHSRQLSVMQAPPLHNLPALARVDASLHCCCRSASLFRVTCVSLQVRWGVQHEQQRW